MTPVDVNAKLFARLGPLEGAVFPLERGQLTLGRGESNTVCLDGDRSVSRNHCVIEERDGRFVVRDLESANRTYVNGVPVDERALEDRDEIRIGRSVFVFRLNGEALRLSTAPVDLDDAELGAGRTVVLRREDAAYLKPERLLDDTAQPARVSRALKSILQACRTLLSVSVLEDLERRLLESIFDFIPAQRGAILLAGDTPDDFSSAIYWARNGGQTAPFRIPRALIRRVLEERASLCINDIVHHETFAPSETMVQARVTSILAAPLVLSGTAIGVIYSDISDPTAQFGEDDPQLLTGIAEIAAAPLQHALKVDRLERERRELLAELAGGHALVGASDRMRAIHRFILKVAPTESTVLIAGSSGTGKELVARAIHRNSPRSEKPFIAINCAAVAETLLESEFFGHEKGAFTGAASQKKGKLEIAEGGTVFLDEIGELALPLQAKMLRVLQEREFERVGGNRPLRVNIRVIAATNRNLEDEIRRGAFRQDLYYRLNVVAVTMPDLKERRADIPLLAKHFVEKHAAAGARRITGISDEAVACLVNYDWPGNVRELENAIQRAIVLGSTDLILPEDLPDSIVESGPEAGAGGEPKFHETIRQFKAQLVTRALEQAQGNYTDAARILGLHPNNLHRLAKSLNLK